MAGQYTRLLIRIYLSPRALFHVWHGAARKDQQQALLGKVVGRHDRHLDLPVAVMEGLRHGTEPTAASYLPRKSDVVHETQKRVGTKSLHVAN